MTKWRRFEVMLPVQFNEGRPVPRGWIGEAVEEIADGFRIEGRGRYVGVSHRDNLVQIFVDVPDSAKNRTWMKKFKERWKARLEQSEWWLVSHRIDIE